MPAQIVFLTLFLGLVSGKQPVALQVTGPVKTVRLYLDGKEAATATAPSWIAAVDLGPDLTPRELSAVGFDARGEEIARASQILNLPRPIAEFEIVVERDAASLHWRHLMNVEPDLAKITFDGKALAVDKTLRAKLPKFDREVPHVIAAELRFADGQIARRELVIESVRSDSVGTELTPLLLRETAKNHPASWDGCLSSPQRPVRTAAVEKPPALVIIVRDPDPQTIAKPLGLSLHVTFGSESPYRKMLNLDSDTWQRILWPIALRYADNTKSMSALFPPSVDISAAKWGILYPMLVSYGNTIEKDPRRIADAAAVAGVTAITGSSRRAVVVILSPEADASEHDPRVVRRYLKSIGVPLFVWSVTGPRPELADAWGEIDDVSNLGKLAAAVKRLRQTLAEQRIAWVDVDPLRSLHLQAKESCGIAVVARPAP